MELKSGSGDRFEDALNQLVTGVEDTLGLEVDVYMVQRGQKIGFFEYHNDININIGSDIEHFKRCMSITQSYLNNPAPFDPSTGIEQLFNVVFPQRFGPRTYSCQRYVVPYQVKQPFT